MYLLSKLTEDKEVSVCLTYITTPALGTLKTPSSVSTECLVFSRSLGYIYFCMSCSALMMELCLMRTMLGRHVLVNVSLSILEGYRKTYREIVVLVYGFSLLSLGLGHQE